jgi:hypothetical protein
VKKAKNVPTVVVSLPNRASSKGTNIADDIECTYFDANGNVLGHTHVHNGVCTEHEGVEPDDPTIDTVHVSSSTTVQYSSKVQKKKVVAKKAAKKARR